MTKPILKQKAVEIKLGKQVLSGRWFQSKTMFPSMQDLTTLEQNGKLISSIEIEVHSYNPRTLSGECEVLRWIDENGDVYTPSIQQGKKGNISPIKAFQICSFLSVNECLLREFKFKDFQIEVEKLNQQEKLNQAQVRQEEFYKANPDAKKYDFSGADYL